MIEYIADRVMEYQAKDTEGATLLSSYNTRLKETETAINGILKAIEDGLYTATMKERMGELEAQKEDLKASISREEINQRKVTREELIFFLERFKGGNPEDPEYCRRLVDTFVNSIWLYDDKLVLTYNFSGEKNKVTLEMVDAALDGCASGCSDKACATPPKNPTA